MLLTGWVLVFTIYLILEGFSLQLLALRPITFTTTLFSEQLHTKKKGTPPVFPLIKETSLQIFKNFLEMIIPTATGKVNFQIKKIGHKVIP